jgi:hypothetical protein
MHLNRRLRRQADARAWLDDDRLPEVVSTKDARSGRRQDQMQAVAVWQRRSDAEGRLAVRVLQDRLPAATAKRQFEAGPASDVSRGPIVAD